MQRFDRCIDVRNLLALQWHLVSEPSAIGSGLAKRICSHFSASALCIWVAWIVGVSLSRGRQLLLCGGDVGIDSFIERAGLGQLELSAAESKLSAFQNCHLVCELIDFDLAEKAFVVFAGDNLGVLSNLGHRFVDWFTQLLCV